MKRIAIVGSGHLGQQITHYIREDSNDKVVAFFDDFQKKDTIIKGIPVIGGNANIEEYYLQNKFDAVLIAIGYKYLKEKKRIFETLKRKVPFYTFIHSSVFIDPSAEIGEGTVIYPRCVIDQGVEVGDHVLMNVSCTIAHDTKIGSHSFISPSVAVAGFVNIGEQCIIGINSTIIDNINIVTKTQIGGGTVVINNLDKPGLYVGNPARFVK